jgi:hypothetical protein
MGPFTVEDTAIMRHPFALIIVFILISITDIGATKIPIIDSHSQVDQKIPLTEILSLMDQAKVAHTILAARGRRKPKDIISFANRYPNRITPAVRTKGGAYLEGPKQFKLFLEKQMRSPQFGAMAEVLLWHAKKRRLPA